MNFQRWNRFIITFSQEKFSLCIKETITNLVLFSRLRLKYFRFSGNLDTDTQTWLFPLQFTISFYDSGQIDKKMDLYWRIWSTSLHENSPKRVKFKWSSIISVNLKSAKPVEYTSQIFNTNPSSVAAITVCLDTSTPPILARSWTAITASPPGLLFILCSILSQYCLPRGWSDAGWN